MLVSWVSSRVINNCHLLIVCVCVACSHEFDIDLESSDEVTTKGRGKYQRKTETDMNSTRGPTAQRLNDRTMIFVVCINPSKIHRSE